MARLLLASMLTSVCVNASVSSLSLIDSTFCFVFNGTSACNMLSSWVFYSLSSVPACGFLHQIGNVWFMLCLAGREHILGIHREAPSFIEQGTEQEILETGIKVIRLLPMFSFFSMNVELRLMSPWVLLG